MVTSSKTLLIAVLVFAGTVASQATEMSDRGISSAEFPSDGVASEVLNLDPKFNWIGTLDRFWFKRQTSSGSEFTMVDADTGRQSPVFDAVETLAALNAAHEGAPKDADLAISNLTFEEDGKHLIIETPAGSFLCSFPVSKCEARAPEPGPDLVISPDGRSAVFRRANDLWLRDLRDGKERQLTSDGVPDFGYGDIDRWEDNLKVARRRGNIPLPLLGVLWSPDGRFILGLRQDLRPFPSRLLVTEYVPPDGRDPVTHSLKIAMPMDPMRPESRLVVIDTRSLKVQQVELDPQALNDWALAYFTSGVVWWTKDDADLFFLSANHGGSRYALNSLDLATGRVRVILSETARFNVRLNPIDYSRPNVWVSSKGNEAIWYSERSGYGHLYLVDVATGRIKRQITKGDWVVFDLLHVDEARRIAYFTAGPRDSGTNPYLRQLYSVSLDKGDVRRLTPEQADHDFNNPFGVFLAASGPSGPSGSRISPTGRYFVDVYSTTSEPPKAVLRKITGELVADVITSNAAELDALGWKPPERVKVKATDKTTDLYGVLFKPRYFDPGRTYPVVEYTYPGPQMRFAPISFKDVAGPDGRLYWPLVRAGFVVVAIDGRGTADRSRSFRDAFLGTEDVMGAADHVAAIRNLAADRPYMDLGRIGVTGGSSGGYASLRAMLLFPEFFKVAVSVVGPSEWFYLAHEPSVERLFGVPTASPAAYARFASAGNTHLLSRLKGDVLLMYGGIDENVPLRNAFMTFQAFIEADKDVDMILLPESTHAVYKVPYALRRTVQYFVQKLGASASCE